MVYSLKRIVLGIAALVAAVPTMGQKPSVEVSVPAVVAVGDFIRVEFKSDTKPDDFVLPEVTGLELLAGPTMHESIHVEINNGNFESKSLHTYTYVFISDKPGKFTIPRAKFTVGGTSYYTKQTVVEVVDGGVGNNPPSQQASASRQGEGGQSAAEPSSKLAADDLKLVVHVDRTSVFKGQPVKVVIKLYARANAVRCESYKLPTFNGFWMQDVTATNYALQRETLNGKVYDSQILFEYLAYPQQAGKLTIDPMEFMAVVQVVTQAPRRQSIFDDFFGGGAYYEEVRRKLTSSPVHITVRNLPAGAPSSFNGAVGNFTMEAGTPASEITANSASTYSIKISGMGNLSLIQVPKIELPAAFEQYTAKTTESLNPSSSGIHGFRQFEYPFIARAEGEHTIEPFEFTYFNPEQARYVTLTSKAVKLNVTPDNSGGGSQGIIHGGARKEDVKMLGEDIRFIKIGRPEFVMAGSMFMGSKTYYMTAMMLVVSFMALLAYLRKLIKDRRNTVAIRGRRANKVALQRLNTAAGFMKEGNRRQFYEEMLRALWGYMGDKLNIPVSNLTKENVREGLVKYGVSAERAEKFIEVISDCELAQYSPEQAGHMQEIYNNAISSISKLETIIRKSA